MGGLWVGEGLKPRRQALSALFPPVPQMNPSPTPWPLMATMWTTRTPSTSEYDTGAGLDRDYGAQGRFSHLEAGSDWCNAAFGLHPWGPHVRLGHTGHAGKPSASSEAVRLPKLIGG